MFLVVAKWSRTFLLLMLACQVPGKRGGDIARIDDPK